MNSITSNNIYTAVKQYADAWLSNDLKTIIACYHDDVIFHYFGQNSLSGTHTGKAACLALLKQVKEKTNRKLIKIVDVLAGEHFGVIVAVEHFERNGQAVEFERILRYRVNEGKLAECWIYDQDQRLVDEFLS
jgi:uncharacterized protein